MAVSLSSAGELSTSDDRSEGFDINGKLRFKSFDTNGKLMPLAPTSDEFSTGTCLSDEFGMSEKSLPAQASAACRWVPSGSGCDARTHRACESTQGTGFCDLKVSKRMKLSSDAASCVIPQNDSLLIMGLSDTTSVSHCGMSSGSSRTVQMKASEQEGSNMDLDLGLTPYRSLDVCTMPVFSSSDSVLTTVGLTHVRGMENHSLGSRYSHSFFSSGKGRPQLMKAFDIACSGFAESSEMQSQLGAWINSSIVDHVSSIPLLVNTDAAIQDITLEGNCISVFDEGSTSARSRKCGGDVASFLMGHRIDNTGSFEVQPYAGNGGVGMARSNLEADFFHFLKSANDSISTNGASGSTSKSPLVCNFQGCGKNARGASGLCIAHGGGIRCQKQGCNKGADRRTTFCKGHGGGRRCESLGCPKSAEGKTEYCIAHGGDRRCSHQEGCAKAARGPSGFCIRHGGGKRCQKEGCTKSAEGYTGLCILHGGGRRCQYPDCGKGAQGNALFCKAHGCGKRCMIPECDEGAEGSTLLRKAHGGGKRCLFDDGDGACSKSVHGGTFYCITHGGGKRCAIQECTKSARDRADFCGWHGGVEHWQAEYCKKSAQGSTDFCKAHGGRQRCIWGQEESLLNGEFLQGRIGDLSKSPCMTYVRGKLGLCAAHDALVHDQRVHGAATLEKAFHQSLECGLGQESQYIASIFDRSKDSSTIADGYLNTLEVGGSGSFMQASSSYGSFAEVEGMEEDTSYPCISAPFNRNLGMEPVGSAVSAADDDDTICNLSSLSLLDERVHGGNILALLSSEAKAKGML